MFQKNVKGDKEDRTDRRIRRTRSALRKALVDLIREKGYDAISVEEITQTANLGRATFYLHYKDKDDLLLEEFNERVIDQTRLISQVPLAIWGMDRKIDINNIDRSTLPMSMIFKHAAENADFYRVVLRGASSKRVANRIKEVIIQSYYEVFEKKFPGFPEQKKGNIKVVELMAVYFSGVLITCIDWWLNQDPMPPADEISKIFQDMYVMGILRFITDIRQEK